MVIPTEYQNYSGGKSMSEEDWCESMLVFNHSNMLGRYIITHRMGWKQEGFRGGCVGVWRIKYKLWINK